MKKLLILLVAVCTTNALMSQRSETRSSSKWTRGIETGMSHWIKISTKEYISHMPFTFNYSAENRLNEHWSVKATGGLFCIDKSSVLAIDAGIEPRYYFTAPNESKLNWFAGIPVNGYLSLADGTFGCDYFLSVSPVVGARKAIGNRFFIEGELGATFLQSLDKNDPGDAWFSNLSIKLGYSF